MIDVCRLKFDAAGLIPAVLVDDATNDVLMVAWMNADALAQTLRTRLATFWSRSRQELWTKGATSGNYMHVVSITADCDADTLLVRVKPDGPACHTGKRSCFFQELTGLGAGEFDAFENEETAGQEGFPPRVELTTANADYHMHTIWSDGKDTPRDMIEEALACGLARIGISDHSFVSFDTDYPIPPERYALYRTELAALKDEYAGQIEVLCGMEQDYYGIEPGPGFDYLIGSVHYVRVPGKAIGTCVSPENPDGEYLPLDMGPDTLRLGINRFFNGDPYALVEAYYERVGDLVFRTGCRIIGHFDLIKLYNKDNAFFDENDPRYVAAWQKAADSLLKTGVLFEINVSAKVKGYCAEPYPGVAIARYLADHGARFIVSSDSHTAEAIRNPASRRELDPYAFCTFAQPRESATQQYPDLSE